MKTPFEYRAVKNFAIQELRNGTTERRLAAICSKRFSAYDIEMWEWEAAVAAFLKKYHAAAQQAKPDASPQNCEDKQDYIFKRFARGNNLFITGKAGTGKTTILRNLVERFNNESDIVVLAPTGIAAKNAYGETIHSFFQLQLGPWLPSDDDSHDIFNISENKKQIMRNLRAIVIDEVSMLRCDILDEIDEVLKYARNSREPFGGVQIVLFGDLYQLIPVVEEDDMDKLKLAYDEPFFFNSKVFGKVNFTVVVLDKVYRQDNIDFIELLNAVRVGKVSSQQLATLNRRYSAQNAMADFKGAVRLTTHNYRAKAYNGKKLDGIFAKEFQYKAYINKYTYADLPKADFPTDYYLKLKVGARVMFLRNDNTYKRYVNGTLGTVVDLWDDGIIVRTDEGINVNLTRSTWEFYHYRYDAKSKRIVSEIYADFKQFPIKLAWAVTIHKSQGLSFDNVVIDAEKSFAAGQVYVALSRCRTFAGVHLVSPIMRESIIISPVVQAFYDKIGLEG